MKQHNRSQARRTSGQNQLSPLVPAAGAAAALIEGASSPSAGQRSVRADLIRAAGVVILLLSAGAALLPLLGPISGTVAIGMLLLLAGIVEMFAGSLRHQTRSLAILAGAATAVAGLLFLLNDRGELLSSVWVVAAWLLARAAILFLTSLRSGGSVKMWIRISALTDLGLGFALLAGLSVVSLVVTLFGPAPQIVASFAWVLALSFIATGTLLLEVAGCEGRTAAEIQRT